MSGNAMFITCSFQIGSFVQNLLSRELPYYQKLYATGLSLLFKKFCMGLSSLRVRAERILFQNSKCQPGENVTCTLAGGGVLPYMGRVDMCGPVSVINKVWFCTLGLNWVCFF